MTLATRNRFEKLIANIMTSQLDVCNGMVGNRVALLRHTDNHRIGPVQGNQLHNLSNEVILRRVCATKEERPKDCRTRPKCYVLLRSL